MMTTQQLKTLAVYKDTRDGLVELIGMLEGLFTSLAPSDDPDSSYQRSLAALLAAVDQLRALAVTSLKKIDQDIAQSDLVRDIGVQAKGARKEAGRIAKTAQHIEEASALIGGIADIVTTIGGFPFLP
jgi:hypothetical protein